MACSTVITETTQLQLKGCEDDVQFGDLRKRSATAKEFKVLDKRVCLPRYAYHKFLVDLSLEGADLIDGFAVDPMTECIVLVGGDLSKENESLLSSDIAEGNCFSDFTTEMVVGVYMIFLYFMTQDDMKKTESLLSYLTATSEEFQCKEADLLLILPKDIKPSSAEDISAALQKIQKLRFRRVFSVKRESKEIRQTIAKTFQSSLIQYLRDAAGLLSELPSAEHVEECLEKIRAIIETLQEEQHNPKRPYNKQDVLDIIKPYQDKILYLGFNTKGVRITITDQSVMAELENRLSNVGNFEVKISVQEKITTAPFNFPLHGAKFVPSLAPTNSSTYATIGSLVKRKGSIMAAITCLHPFLGIQNPGVTVNINLVDVKLGSVMFHVQDIRSIHDDIALIDVDEQIIESDCEKRLLNGRGQPTSAYISNCRDLIDLDKFLNTVVRKRGARTLLTTGVVSEVCNITYMHYSVAGSAIIVKPFFKNTAFAKRGDSGSLVFLPSSSNDNKLEVIGMVCSEAPQEVFHDERLVLCAPLRASVDNLIDRIPNIERIDFY
ncbi:uncharacterized protein LOC134249856 [Saccostrea cucullata]|uniref:uncharacterized protein LOC134249856 n=1 Tax=Saccostrea cuccullata TaxID=36930 RepID=UPI002ED6095B